MIRLWLVFAILFAAFYFGIPAFRKLKGAEKWDVTKTLLFSFGCSLLAVGVMIAVVVLF
jgi:cytochrome c oxidase assembly factor CtaG